MNRTYPMKIQPSNFFMLIFFLCCALSSSAQDFRSELKKISSLYSEGSMSYDFSYSYFSNEIGSIDQTMSGSLVKKDDYYSYIIGSNHIIRTEKHILVIDSRHKVLLLDSVTSNLGMTPMIPIDSLFQFYKNMKRTVDGDQIRYEMEVELMGGTKVAMTINKIDLSLQKIEMWMGEDQTLEESGKMVMNFSNVKLKPELFIRNPSEFEQTILNLKQTNYKN